MSLNTGQLERGIRGDYQKQVSAQVRKEGISGNVRVDKVDCIKKGAHAARCFATVSGAVDGRVPINVTIDGKKYLWETDEKGLGTLTPTATGTSGANPSGAAPATSPDAGSAQPQAAEKAARAVLQKYKSVGFLRVNAVEYAMAIFVKTGTSASIAEQMCEAARGAASSFGTTELVVDEDSGVEGLAHC